MTTPKAKFADLALIAALCAGFIFGLTAPAWAGEREGFLAYQRADYATALREWRPLAEKGNAKVQFMIGLIYSYHYKGQGVPQDYVQAHMWFNLAASKFSPGEARDSSANARDGVAKIMTPAQISEAQKLAGEWKPKK